MCETCDGRGGWQSIEEELSYYKTQYETLEVELQEFQTSSKELEAELEQARRAPAPQPSRGGMFGGLFGGGR